MEIFRSNLPDGGSPRPVLRQSVVTDARGRIAAANSAHLARQAIVGITVFR